MRNPAFLLVAAALATVLGCSGGADYFCSHGQSEATSLSAKASPCGASAGDTSGFESTCSKAESLCTTADKAAINAYYGCLDGLPVCDPSNMSPWSSALATCNAKLDPVTTECRGGLGL